MLERLTQRFELLASRRTDKESRHRSLWAAIDWSYHLLTPEQQRFFGRLSVFRGGWTAEAAESICDDPHALECLSQLRVHSLVAAGETDSEMRFRLLEAVREFAWEQMAEEERRDVQRRHLAFYNALAAAAEPNFKGPEQASWLRRLDTDHDNLRAALAWCGEANDAAGELRLAGALWRFWAMRGHVSEGRQHLADAIAHAVALGIPAGRAAALRGAGNLAYLQGDLAAATARHEEHLVLCRESGDAVGVATALSDLGNVACAAGDYGQAQRLFEESLAFDRARGDRPGVASSLLNLGNVAYFQGDLSTARALHEEALPLMRESGDRQNVANSLLTLGSIAYEQAGYEAAAAHLAESLSLLRELGDRNGIAAALENLATLALAEDETERARRLFEESLALGREMGIPTRIAGPLSGLGHLARDRGDVAAARTLWRESIEILRQVGDRRGVAHLLEGFASLELARPGHKPRVMAGAPQRAARLLATADILREAAGVPRSANERARYEDDLTRVRADLGEPLFDEAWAAGRAMTLDEAVASALQEYPGV
jgi:tetratricopeptide (TPR) repeat protein